MVDYYISGLYRGYYAPSPPPPPIIRLCGHEILKEIQGNYSISLYLQTIMLLKALLNFGNGLDYDSILSAVNMQSLGHRRYYQSLVLLFNCIKGNGPGYISNLFEPRILLYNLRNSDHNLIQPSYNNYHNSFTYKASHLWNQLPSYINRSTELSEYCKYLGSFNFTILRGSCKCNFCIS